MSKTRNRYPQGAPVFKHRFKGTVVGVDFYGQCWIKTITADGDVWIAHTLRCKPLNADARTFRAIASRL